MKKTIDANKTEDLFRDVFFTTLAMIIFPLNIFCLIYWIIKKNSRLLKIGLGILPSIFITIMAFIIALCIVYKVTPATLFENGRFYIQESAPIVDKNGYLEVGGRMLQIFTDEGYTISYDKEKVVLYTTEDESRLILYEDSGIEVGSLSQEELSEKMLLENPADYFDVYNEKHHTVAEKIGINERDAYVSYTQGLFEDFATETYEGERGAYTEVYVLQDIGAKTYLRIRVADYTGEAPSVLVSKYAIAKLNMVA